MLSFTDVDVFKLNDQGNYYKKNFPTRIQGMTGLNIGLNYDIVLFKKFETQVTTLFFNYQFWFQMPFVKGYVPVLPNVALHLGASFPMFK